MTHKAPTLEAMRTKITVTGVVQGVGFRPFVHRLATELGLTGFVGNDAAAVFIEAQGPGQAIAELTRRLSAEAPPLALITGIRAAPAEPRAEDGFVIVASTNAGGARTLVPPDVATCDACLRELLDPASRRYRHPFITCTDCGPRFTIIADLPYDRPATTMAGFPMCEQCEHEYHDPADRRFHAQPISCHDCGPTLRFTRDGVTITGADNAIIASQRVLAEGGIVAVKGIGGYHLACRADCQQAVARLRELKARGDKPFALLTQNLSTARLLAEGDSAFCSAHIGDMGSLATLRAFDRVVTQLTTVHRATPEVIAADLHPAYRTRAWAQDHAGGPGEPVLHLVQHHHAHVASLLAEHGRLGQPVIGIAFDGTGYGIDGTIWGGEVLFVGPDPTRFDRLGHLLPVPLAGGDAAVRNPCRTALAYLAVAGVAWDQALPPVAACTGAERTTLAALYSGGRAPGAGMVPCSSMGRLFDAVASLLGVRHRISYEAQAAIELEILAAQASDAEAKLMSGLALPVGEHGIIDHRPLIRALADRVLAGCSTSALARAFHLAVADAVADSACQAAGRTGVRTVGLTGGVFQNVLLTGVCRARLEARGLAVLTHHLVPPNDGGLALGQAAIAALAALPDWQPPVLTPRQSADPADPTPDSPPARRRSH